VSYVQAMDKATKELANQRFLMTTSAYRAAFDDRVAELLNRPRHPVVRFPARPVPKMVVNNG
jgi:hypothetical protein